MILQLLIAQGSDTSINSWTPLVSSLTSIGFSAVVGWYLLTKALPKLQEDSAKELKEQRKDFLEDIKAKRSEFVSEMKEQRQTYKESLAMVLQHCDAETNRREKTLEIELQQMTRAMEEQSKVLEELRDLLKVEIQEFRKRRGGVT